MVPPTSHRRNTQPPPRGTDPGTYPACTWMYPGVAGALGLATWRVLGSTWLTPAFCAAAVFSTWLALIDARTLRLPRRIMNTAMTVAVLSFGFAMFADVHHGWHGAVGYAGGYAVFTVLAMIKPGGLGYGDVRLAGYLGAHLALVGPVAWVMGLLIPFVIAAPWAVTHLIRDHRIRKPTPAHLSFTDHEAGALPFGPFLVMGAALAMAWFAPGALGGL